MAELEEFTEVSADNMDPFGGDGKRVEVDSKKKVNTSQLADEIQAKHGSTVNVVLNRNDDGTRVLWVKPKNVDGRTIRGVLNSHEYDEEWGLTEEEADVRDKIQRLTNGEQLSLDELNSIIREFVSPE